MGGDPQIAELLRSASQVCISPTVLGGLHSAFRRGTRTAQNQKLLQDFLSKPSVIVLDRTSQTALRYAEVDAYLYSKGRPIPRNDVWIAASALEHGCILVTRDAHFRELPLLPIWP
jgi:tRNA(fMet)-specific endonuclease VapC